MGFLAYELEKLSQIVPKGSLMNSFTSLQLPGMYMCYLCG